jgi:hypothetical protein
MVRVLDALSPIIRTAVQACMSRAVIRRENCFMNRSCSCIAPHWSDGYYVTISALNPA